MKPDDLAYLYSLTNEYRSIRYDLANMRALAESSVVVATKESGRMVVQE